MKTMVIIQDEAERKALLDIWNEMQKAKAAGEKFPTEGNMIESALFSQCRGSCDAFSNKAGEKGNEFAIVYDLLDDGWHVYNFNTMEEEVIPNGDLAGFANSKPGNFPFFN